MVMTHPARGSAIAAFSGRSGGGSRRGLAVLAAASAAVLWVAASAAVAKGAVGGGAYALSGSVNALLAPVSVGALPSVTLPPKGGGPFTESLLSANAAGLAPARVATVSTEGNSGIGSVTSSSSVLDAALAGVVTVGAARSRCSARAGSASGSASVVDLVVAGIPIATADAGPNTTIALPVGSVIVNEQRRSGASGIAVNAVRISLGAAVLTGDVVIAQSRCSTTSSRARGRALRAKKRFAR